MIWYQLYRPFAFSNIENRDLSRIRTAVPAALTLVLFLLYMLLPVKPQVIGDKKYLDYILQIVGILPGFYIAALAAAATFANPALDEPMPGRDAPVLDIHRGGQVFSEPMTMRVFICHLFAYLSAISFVTALLALSAIELAPSIEYLQKRYTDVVWSWLIIGAFSYLGVALITFYFIRVILVTFHGLFFIVERMHQGNR